MAKKHPKKVGLPPGTLVYTGEKDATPTRAGFTTYDQVQFRERAYDNELPPLPAGEQVHWYDFRGLNNSAFVGEIGRAFGLHPLLMEDVLDTAQRPKYEEFDNGFFLILKSLHWDERKRKLTRGQVSLFCGDRTVLTFHENLEDDFLPVRERLRTSRGKIRQRGADYLAYALADTIVDQYLSVLDRIQQDIETLEEELVESPSPDLRNRIHHVKRAVLEFRRVCLPTREAILKMQRNDSPFIQDQTTIFLRDLVDNIIQVTDSIDTFRDMLNSLQDLSLSELSYRMNNVIQVLTIISTIFIPLTFLVGVYGMNFRHMPELGWRYGYPTVWVLMLLISLGLIAFFRHKRWL